MNFPTTHHQPANSAARRVLCLAASILGLLVLAFGVAPGTVLASSATDVYTEQEPPVKPNTNNGGNNGGNTNNDNGGTTNNGGNANTGSNGSDDTGSTSDTGSSGDGSGSNGDPYKAGKKYSQGGYNPATDSDEKSGSEDQKAGKEDSDDSTIAATPTGGDGGDGDGGSSLPIIIAILIGVPLIGAGAYYGWTRYRVRDDETKDRLKSALGSDKPTGTN